MKMRNAECGMRNIIKIACGMLLFGWALAASAQIATMPTPAPKSGRSTAEIKLGASCITAECHATLNKSKFIHGPMNIGQCEPCHVTINNKHEFKAIPDTKMLCKTCHESEAPKKDIHKPFGVDCTLCHSPHGGDNRYFVKGGTGSEGCYRCHNDITKGMNFKHGPVGQGECLACHTPHQSDQPKLLAEPETKLCLSCHTDFEDQMKGAISVHPPAQKDCAGCHGPHGGNTKYFLPAQGRELCMKCHGEFIKNMDKVKYPHMPMVEGKSCEGCHSPHASKQEKLLIGKNEELCLGCHDKPIPEKTRTLPSIAAQIKDSKYLHGPLRQQNCIACHAAHGSDNPNILVKPFPAGFYSEYTDHAYDLCFACHDKKIVLNSTSTDTGFRNGDRNLHYLHVHQEKGRSCHDCHDEHGSNQPKHIREEVLFGRWPMHTTFTITPTGGGCQTGCHQLFKYDRQNAVDNKVPSSPATRAKKKA